MLGGDRNAVPICIEDKGRPLGFVLAVIDNGCPITALFPPALKRMRVRIPDDAKKAIKPLILGGLEFDVYPIGEKNIVFRDAERKQVKLSAQFNAAILRDKRKQFVSEFFDMLIGLDFLTQHKLNLDFAKPELFTR